MCTRLKTIGLSPFPIIVNRVQSCRLNRVQSCSPISSTSQLSSLLEKIDWRRGSKSPNYSQSCFSIGSTRLRTMTTPRYSAICLLQFSITALPPDGAMVAVGDLHDRTKIYGFDDLTLTQTSVTQCRYDWGGKSFLREGNAPSMQTERLDFDDDGIRS